MALVRVLLVEDNRTFREAFRNNLAAYFPGLIIDEAANGEETLEKVRNNPPDLIFMDMRLPGKNGLQLTEEIKKAHPKMVIAFLTGYDIPEYREAALQKGADQYFVKESLKWPEVETLVNSLGQTEG
jgi:DNA-binding NarL/FixJ family response regulator